jgi:hypothetical protein
VQLHGDCEPGGAARLSEIRPFFRYRPFGCPPNPFRDREKVMKDERAFLEDGKRPLHQARNSS